MTDSKPPESATAALYPGAPPWLTKGTIAHVTALLMAATGLMAAWKGGDDNSRTDTKTNEVYEALKKQGDANTAEIKKVSESQTAMRGWIDGYLKAQGARQVEASKIILPATPPIDAVRTLDPLPQAPLPAPSAKPLPAQAEALLE